MDAVNFMKIALSTHPENYSKVLARSFLLYRRAFFRVIFLSLVLSIIVFIPRILTVILRQDLWADVALFNPKRIGFVLIDLISLTLFTAMLWRIRCVITDMHETFFDDLKTTFRKIPRIIVASLLQIVMVLAMNLLFFVVIYYMHPETASSWKIAVPIIILFFIQFFLAFCIYLLFYFYLPTILIENEGVISSLTKSASLVWKNLWRTWIVQVTPWLAYLACLLFLQVALKINIHIYFIEDIHPPTWTSTVLHIALFALFLPWTATTMITQLRDLELRKLQKNPL